MSRTLNDFETQIQDLLRDTTGGTVTTDAVTRFLNRRIRELRNRHGVHGGRNYSSISVFPGIYEYPLPSDYGDFINIQDRENPLNFYETTADEFWTRLNQIDDAFAINGTLGANFCLIKSNKAGTSALVHNCDSLTDNGTWSADTVNSDALNLVADTEVYKTAGASLRFDIDVSQSVNDYAAIVNSDLTAVDLSRQEDIGTLFIWVYLPEVTNITNVTARWGSSSTDYWSNSTTEQYNGNSFAVGWNRVGVAWSGASETGTPDSSAVDYLYVQISYGAAQTDANNFRVDDIVMKGPSEWELQYYSKNLCEDSSGNTQEELSDGDDTTVIDSAFDDWLFYMALADAYWTKELYPDVQTAKQEATNILGRVLPRYHSDRNRARKRYY